MTVDISSLHPDPPPVCRSPQNAVIFRRSGAGQAPPVGRTDAATAARVTGAHATEHLAAAHTAPAASLPSEAPHSHC